MKKCVLCNGKLVKKIVEYKEFGILLGKFKADACQKCGEVFFEEKVAERIQQKSKEMNLFGMAKRTKIAKVGNSLAVRIPKEIAQHLQLKKGQEVSVFPENKHYLHIQV